MEIDEFEEDRFVRTNDKIITGLCAAVAKRYGIKKVYLRSVLLFLGISTSMSVFLVYLLFSLFLPYEDDGKPNESMEKLKQTITVKDIPRWYVYYASLSVVPILAWPMVFFATIFIFDNPPNFFMAFLLFCLIVIYPIYLMFILTRSLRLFRKNQKVLAMILPIIPILVFIGFLL